MAQNKSALTDEEYLYSHLAEYLDESLSSSNRQKFEEIAKRLNQSELVTDYGIRRGRLQIEAQRLYVDEKKMHKIHELVEDDAARANHEAAEIEEVGRSELKGNGKRFVILTLLFFGLVFGAWYRFRPEPKPTFKALDALLYESIVMTEDPKGRLDFPTDKLDELNQYFQNYPNLGFTAKMMKTLPAEWSPTGGTVIDYDAVKIMAVQFSSSKTQERQYLFFYPGKLSQLPKSDIGNANGIIYQTYASDRLNIVAWESTPGKVVGMVIGARGAKELAEFAFAVVGP